MLSIVSQVNPISNYKNEIKKINFKNKPKEVSSRNDSFESQEKILTKEDSCLDSKSKFSKIDRLVSNIVMIGFAALILFTFFKKNKNPVEDSSIDSYKFKILKDNANIPSLDSCKSLDRDLKEILKKQVNLSKAGSDLLEEVGEPIQANRFLLAGPPGTGKTFFSKIYAKTIDAEYLEVLYSDINSRWVGHDIEKMDSLFKKIMNYAKNNPEKKYVITFNEIDSLLPPLEQLVDSSGGTNFSSLRRQRSTFLTYLDRLAEETPNVIIIGTTNMKANTKNLDAATMSRFSNTININYPNKDCLYEAIKENVYKIKNINNFIAENDDKLKNLAKTMQNRKFSYRDLESMLNDAKILYLEEKLNNKNTTFKFKYLEEALKNLKNTDGEKELIK